MLPPVISFETVLCPGEAAVKHDARSAQLADFCVLFPPGCVVPAKKMQIILKNAHINIQCLNFRGMQSLIDYGPVDIVKFSTPKTAFEPALPLFAMVVPSATMYFCPIGNPTSLILGFLLNKASSSFFKQKKQ